MATTKIWPIKDSLKRVVDYAVNPAKTENPDSDLFNVLHYASNGDKTEMQFYVTGINCVDKLAYEKMIATKKRYGKTGGNVAYHCYQSFKPGEVNAEQCHEIGVELAKKLWGGMYEVVVATHLNTNCFHNHFVINSVSCVDGRKFDDNKRTYAEMRRTSDDICREHGLSVIENPYSKKVPRAAYLAQKSGKETHYSILKRDVDEALSKSMSFYEFEKRLKAMGYRFPRTENYKYRSIIAEGWKRPMRLKSLGDDYTDEAIRERLVKNQYLLRNRTLVPYTPKKPLSDLRYNLNKVDRMSTIDGLFWVICELLKLVLVGEVGLTQRYQPLSPVMRQEVIKLERYDREFRLLHMNEIHSEQELRLFIDSKKEQLDNFISQRKSVDYRIRRPKSDQDLLEQKAKRHTLSEQITFLRKQIKIADGIFEDVPRIKDLIEIEHRAEQEADFINGNSHNKEQTKER
ncbi:MAG: relaxase/mobilization nuclease domain-containing protein [Clostridia bacterium]|nr:relaxase/mobilization nuclease domain-containing protein [Clostridia bacterium]